LKIPQSKSIHFAIRVRTRRVARLYSVLHSEIALSRKPFRIGHTHTLFCCLEWPIWWPLRILTFTPGTLCVLWWVARVFYSVQERRESLLLNTSYVTAFPGNRYFLSLTYIHIYGIYTVMSILFNLCFLISSPESMSRRWPLDQFVLYQTLQILFMANWVSIIKLIRIPFELFFELSVNWNNFNMTLNHTGSSRPKIWRYLSPYRLVVLHILSC
jgi:hypothetical protein